MRWKKLQLTFKRKRLTDKQLETLSNISADIGQAVFAITILPFIFQQTTVSQWNLLLGSVLTVLSWVVSLYVVKYK